MYYVAKPSKIQIYVNSARKTTAQIKKELGCDVLINGGIYDMKKYIPYCWLKVDSKLLATDPDTYFGYGWDSNRLVMDTSANVGKYRNFIACVELVRDGQLTKPLIFNPAMGNRRGRTAIGVRADGSVVAYCTKDGSTYASTPEQLQVEMRNLGCVSALMLDGGLSSQCIMPNGTITSTRDGPNAPIHKYIAIWIAKESAPPQNTLTPATPTCADGTKDACQYRLPCHYCLKQYKMCPLITS